VYGWIWRQLPGTTAVKTVEALLLLVTVVALLLFVVFPWVEPMLPFNNTTVGLQHGVTVAAAATRFTADARGQQARSGRSERVGVFGPWPLGGYR
jgi:accessory gene regulator protein AgrB